MLVECLFIQLIVRAQEISFFSTGNHRTTSHKVTVKHGYSHVIKVGHIFGRFRRLGVRLVGRGITYHGYCKYFFSYEPVSITPMFSYFFKNFPPIGYAITVLLLKF